MRRKKGKASVRRSPRRWLILGCGGSGKSTFSLRMGAALGLPLHHLDSLYWKPGWGRTPNDEWEKVVRELVSRPAWIIDGSYLGTLDIRLARAEAVVLFDLPVWVCLWRVLKRRLTHLQGSHRLGMPPGCPERIYGTFVKWVWNYRKRQHPEVLDKLGKFSKRGKVHLVKTSRDADELLMELTVRGRPSPGP